MLTSLKKIGRAVIPKSIFRALQPTYHGAMAQLASLYFGNPSSKLFVIGVTGTAGKSTTVLMTAKILNFANFQTGYITTTGFSDGTNSVLNKHGLSMPGGWLLQKQLREMLNAGCKFAVVECTSEGLAQNRHLGINFQSALFTNLSPAHLDSHGSFENYRKAKGKLFEALSFSSNDKRNQKILGVNLDDPNRNFFLNFPATKKFGVSMREDIDKPQGLKTFKATNIQVTNKISFTVEDTYFELNLFGTFNTTNALLAIGVANEIGVSLETCSKALSEIGNVPGRMETFTAKNGATVIVDYAPEPAGMLASLKTISAMPHNKIIHVFGSTGGHRDVAKRFDFGEISAEFADSIIITNDDVYDSNLEDIAKNIEEGIEKTKASGKLKMSNIEKVLDRKEAIKKAIELAQEKDVVLITGKGSEQFLVLPNNERIAWDDREIVKEFLN